MKTISFFFKYFIALFMTPSGVFSDSGDPDRKKDFKAGSLWGIGETTAKPSDNGGDEGKKKDDENPDAGEGTETEEEKTARLAKEKEEADAAEAAKNKPEGDEPKQDETEEVPVYKIGKDELTEEAYNDVVAKMVKEFDLKDEDIAEMPEKVLDKYLLDFYNIQKGKKALEDKNQAVAKDKRELSAEKTEIEKLRGNVERESKALEDKKKALEAKEKELKATLALDPDDEIDDDKRDDLKYSQRRAKEKLEDLKEDQADLDKELQKAQAKATAVYLKYIITDIQEASGVMTARAVEDILDEATTHAGADLDKWLEKNGPEYKKAKAIKKVMNDYLEFMTNNQSSKLTPGQFYKLNKDDYPDAAPTDSKGSKNNKVTVKDLSVKKAIQNVLKKQAAMPPNPGGLPTDSTASNRNGKGPNKTKAKEKILKAYNME